MKTDLDRLRQTVLYGSGRGCGKTFAVCHYVAGLFRTDPGSSIAWILPRMDYIWHIGPMLKQVLQEHGLEFTRVNRTTMRCNECVLRFYLLSAHIEGYDHYVHDFITPRMRTWFSEHWHDSWLTRKEVK